CPVLIEDIEENELLGAAKGGTSAHGQSPECWLMRRGHRLPGGVRRNATRRRTRSLPHRDTAKVRHIAAQVTKKPSSAAARCLSRRANIGLASLGPGEDLVHLRHYRIHPRRR